MIKLHRPTLSRGTHISTSHSIILNLLLSYYILTVNYKLRLHTPTVFKFQLCNYTEYITNIVV